MTALWRTLTIGLALALPLTPATIVTGSSVEQATDDSAHRAFLDQYCITCHNESLRERGTVPVAFDTLDVADVGPDAEVWEKVVRKMRLRMMPPPGRPRPDVGAYDGFVSWLEG